MLRPSFCGIDFGTSNSTVAIAHGPEKYLVPLEDGKTTLPSAIFFKDKEGPLFGREGISAYMDGEEGRLLRGLKKILGTALMEEKTLIGGKPVAFTHILQTFITHLKESAESKANAAIKHVVMGRPVHFHDDDEAADMKAQSTLEDIARSAGFEETAFLYEPIAAAFAHEARIEDEKLSLVVDLGGGTSDFTLIRISSRYKDKPDRRDDILATSGIRIGGTTFDYRFSLQSFMPALGLGSFYRDIFDKEKHLHVPASAYMQLSDWAMVNFAQTKKAIAETLDIKRRAIDPDKIGLLLKLQQNHLGHALLGTVEDAKIALTSSDTCIAALKELDEAFQVRPSRAAFESCITGDVEKIFHSIENCLAAAQVRRDQVDLVILTGGSTELPVINAAIRARFPHADISQDNKLDSVGLGLAYHAASIF